MRQLRIIAVIAVAVAACSSGSLNDADIEFLQGMIPHHNQAVEMAELVGDATDRTELIDLADRIVATQSEEITLMSGLLADAGMDPTAPGMDGMEHDNTPMMDGMMTGQGMTELGGMAGVDFDVMFAEAMIAHHQGAISAAQTVLTDGSDPEVARLAQAVIDAQTAEIDELTAWLGEWR